MKTVGLFILFCLLAGTSPAALVVTWLDEPLMAHANGYSPPNQAIDLNKDGIVDFTFMTSDSMVMLQVAGQSQIVYTPVSDNVFPPDSGATGVTPLEAGWEIGADLASGLVWDGSERSLFVLAYWIFGPLDSSGIVSFGPTEDGGSFLGVRGYIGAAFYIGDDLRYGWMDVEVGSRNRYAKIYGWGYEDEPGVSILAGAGSPLAVPEPGTLALLGLGGIALIFRRNRRQT